MKCKACGYENDEGAKYCRMCGTKLLQMTNAYRMKLPDEGCVIKKKQIACGFDSVKIMSETVDSFFLRYLAKVHFFIVTIYYLLNALSEIIGYGNILLLGKDYVKIRRVEYPTIHILDFVFGGISILLAIWTMYVWYLFKKRTKRGHVIFQIKMFFETITVVIYAFTQAYAYGIHNTTWKYWSYQMWSLIPILTMQLLYRLKYKKINIYFIN